MLRLSIGACLLASIVFAAPAEEGTAGVEADPTLGDHFEGDIILPNNMGIQSGIIGDKYRWPGNTIPYTLDGAFSTSERNTIELGMKDISSKTCIKFVAQTTQKDYVYIRRGASGSGCYSGLGRQGGRQLVNLEGRGCVHKGIAAHELIHTIGFFHEQSRTDRDDYVTINFQNIPNDARSQFDKHVSNSYGVKYDYGSLMHYGTYAFAKSSNQKTIITKNNARIGQRDAVSSSDAEKIKKMYKC